MGVTLKTLGDLNGLSPRVTTDFGFSCWLVPTSLDQITNHSSEHKADPPPICLSLSLLPFFFKSSAILMSCHVVMLKTAFPSSSALVILKTSSLRFLVTFSPLNKQRPVLIWTHLFQTPSSSFWLNPQGWKCVSVCDDKTLLIWFRSDWGV